MCACWVIFFFVAPVCFLRERLLDLCICVMFLSRTVLFMKSIDLKKEHLRKVSGGRCAGGEYENLPASTAFPISRESLPETGRGAHLSTKGWFVHENALTRAQVMRGKSRNSCLSTCRSCSEAGAGIRVGHRINLLNLAAQVGEGRSDPGYVLRRTLKIL